MMTDLDLALLTDGPVRLIDPAALAIVTAWLGGHGYQVGRVPAGDCATAADLHSAVARGLELPDHYGHNLDALNDVLRSVALAPGPGLVLVLDRYDAFAARHRDTAQTVLDVFAAQARLGLLRGRRMLCLVQSDDPDLAFAPVGAAPVTWHRAAST